MTKSLEKSKPLKLLKEVALTGTDQEIKIPLKGIKSRNLFLTIRQRDQKVHSR